MSNVHRLIKSPPKRESKSMNDGFILIFRGIQKQPWYKNSEYKSVFIHLLLNASYKPVKVNFHGCNINLLPGQLATSYEQLARDLSLTKALVQRAIKKFKSLGQISTLSFKNYTVIMISNWSDFQQKSDTASDTASDTLEHHTKQGLEPSCDTPIDTPCDTQNNNTLSKDRVNTTLTNKFSNEDLVAANYILSKIKTLKDNFKEPRIESWAEQVRLIRERDNKTHREICELFKWANQDTFWQSNILSPKKLRAKWDELEIKSKGTNQASSKTADPYDTSWADGLEVEL